MIHYVAAFGLQKVAKLLLHYHVLPWSYDFLDNQDVVFLETIAF